MQTSDVDILQISRQDRGRGVRLLFERYYRPLVLYAGTLLRDEFTAEDIVQDLFVRLLEGNYLERVDPRALRSYLYSSVRNRCYTRGVEKDALRLALDYTRVEIAEEVLSSLNQQLVDEVMRVINRLPAQTRRVLEGVLMRDMEYRKVAEELHVSINTVKTLLGHGLRVLRETFREKDAWIGIFFARLVHPSGSLFSLILKRDAHEHTGIHRRHHRKNVVGARKRP
ncbi:MAG: sigma-70 family RNA polymerase sigma factor [Odoribacteraceae bacterium]|jgi:RNA polymerase sigma-70 factor (ECF subfamily)|nr:sigma-70 family RNA polymerase sigma factor [Odoribacteraceae bacterium]